MRLGTVEFTVSPSGPKVKLVLGVEPASVVSLDPRWLLRLEAPREAGERQPATAGTVLCAHAQARVRD